jgi:hypothetical protein
LKAYKDRELQDYKAKRIDSSWAERDFVKIVRNYLDGIVTRPLIVSGPHYSGKTTGILQAAGEDALYLLSEGPEDTEDCICAIKESDKKHILIDGYFHAGDKSSLSEQLFVSLQNGKRIVLTGFDAFDLLKSDALHKGAGVVNTAYLSYEEYLRLYHKEKSKTSCVEYLTNGGALNGIDSLDAARQYIEETMVKGLARHLSVDIKEARTLTYIVLHRAVSSLGIPVTFPERNLAGDCFLEWAGIGKEDQLDEIKLRKAFDTLMQTGFITRIQNFCKGSERPEGYYLKNQALAYQLIKAAYGKESEALPYLFTLTVAVQLDTNMMSEHELYFYDDGTGKGPDLIITDKEHEFAYLFFCRFGQIKDSDVDTASVSNCLEQQEFCGMEILGRYVIYNGEPLVKSDGAGEIIFAPAGFCLDYYFEFEINVKEIQRKAHLPAEERDI